MYSTRLQAGHGVTVAFTDRTGGVSAEPFGALNLGRTDTDDIASVAANFDLVRADLGVDRIVTLAQVHSADVVVVDQPLIERWGEQSHLGTGAGADPLPVGDSLVTALADIALCIRIADCVPVLLADPAAGVVGAAHAGRVGFLAGVLPATVEAMRSLGAERIEAWIGPHICGECYEVPQSMVDAVSGDHPAAVSTTSWGTPALDLGAGAAAQLAALGVEVHDETRCTLTSDDLHSHRRDGAGAGRLGAIIIRHSADRRGPVSV